MAYGIWSMNAVDLDETAERTATTLKPLLRQGFAPLT